MSNQKSAGLRPHVKKSKPKIIFRKAKVKEPSWVWRGLLVLKMTMKFVGAVLFVLRVINAVRRFLSDLF